MGLTHSARVCVTPSDAYDLRLGLLFYLYYLQAAGDIYTKGNDVLS